MPKIFLAMLLLVGVGEFRSQEPGSQNCVGTLISLEGNECSHGQVAQQLAQQRHGISPTSAWQCPASHPIKGNFTTYSGERCIYHSPGGQFYEKTKPEMCYVTPADAVADGCRQSRR